LTGVKTIHLSWVIVTLSVDSSADKATILAGYVPVFDQTSIPKTPIMIIETIPINSILITFFVGDVPIML
jgi:nucleoside recognition membrane protein YjiH